MAEEPETVSQQPETWNYFNYFTEVEEHFQRARGTGLFLLSPLDWTLVENWKNAGVPLEAVLRGIDAAFDNWRSRKVRSQNVNSVAYCSQAVQKEAEAIAKGHAATRPHVKAPFELEELRAFLLANAESLKACAQFSDVSAALLLLEREIDVHYSDLEQLEQRLTVLEEKLSAIIRAEVPDEELFAMRREMEAAMRPYKGKMTVDQISMLERSYLDRRVREKAGIPRLSLFYLK